jgi:hypothetical protein
MENIRHHTIKTKIQHATPKSPPKNLPFPPPTGDKSTPVINQGRIPPALDGDGNGGSNDTNGEVIRIILMCNSK